MQSSLRSSLFGSLLETVLQHADFHACSTRALGNRSVAHPNHVDAVGRDLVVQHQVTYHRVRNLPGVGDRGLALTRREALHFDDVTVLILNLGSYLISASLACLLNTVWPVRK